MANIIKNQQQQRKMKKKFKSIVLKQNFISGDLNFIPDDVKLKVEIKKKKITKNHGMHLHKVHALDLIL